MEAHACAKTVTWIARLLELSGARTRSVVPIMEDNTAALYLSGHPNLNGVRTRHMDVRFHWLQVECMEGRVGLVHLSTVEQVADILTKNVSRKIFDILSPRLLGEESILTDAVLAALRTFADARRVQTACFTDMLHPAECALCLALSPAG